MLLCEILAEYFELNLRIQDDSTKWKYRYSLANLEATIGRPAVVEDLTDDNVTRMMRKMQALGLSPHTINDRRSRLVALWTWLARRGVLSRWPTVQQMPEPRRTPQAFTHEELLRLFDACTQQRGSIGPIPACLWWSSLVSLAWDSGERISALLAVRWSDISGEWMHIPAEVRKGKGEDRCYRLSQQSVELLNMIHDPPRDIVLEWPLRREYIWLKFGKVLRDAGLPADRHHKFHALRRSVASHLKARGGDPTEALGHSSPSVTRAYLDPRICGATQPVDLLPSLRRDNPRPPTDDRRRA